MVEGAGRIFCGNLDRELYFHSNRRRSRCNQCFGSFLETSRFRCLHHIWVDRSGIWSFFGGLGVVWPLSVENRLPNMEEIMSTLAQQVRSVAVDALFFAFHDYFSPLFRFVRFLKARAGQTQQTPEAAAPRNNIAKIQWDQGEELRALARTVFSTHQEFLGAFGSVGVQDRHQVISESDRPKKAPGSLANFTIEDELWRYFSLAQGMQLRGEKQRALVVLQLVRTVAERHESLIRPYVWCNIGELLYENAEIEKAEAYFMKVITSSEMSRVVATALSRLAAIRYESRRLDESVSFAQRAVRIYQHIGDSEIIYRAYAQLVAALVEQGRIDEAIAFLRRLHQLSASNGNILIP